MNHQANTIVPNETEQILHLKRLLVTLKQHYEKSLQTAQIQLQVEQNQRSALEKELAAFHDKHIQNEQLHEEEIKALREQQVTLKTLLSTAQEENKKLQMISTSAYNSEQVFQEKITQVAKSKIELEQVLCNTQTKIRTLEEQLLHQQQISNQELTFLQEKLELQKSRDNSFDTVVSPTSSHHLKQELEEIKRSWAKGIQEIKTLESRYVEVLNDKITIEHSYKQLQLQFEHQSSNLTAFQTQIREMDQNRKTLEINLQDKENEATTLLQNYEQCKQQITELTSKIAEKEYVQEKYEQLREEWTQLQENFELAIDMRKQAELSFAQLEILAKGQDQHILDMIQQLQEISHERDTLYKDQNKLQIIIEESEARFKVAQQHLAKKVKEVALLNEKIEEQQNNLTDFIQVVESQKEQITKFNEMVEMYQKQEKRLQEQLHDALKTTENQVAKWEEKYFGMYDKWQASESNVREMKKFEEKCHHMQSLLANLGTFMGNSLNTASLFSPSESVDQIAQSLHKYSTSSTGSSSTEFTNIEAPQEKYDLFGMRKIDNQGQ